MAQAPTPCTAAALVTGCFNTEVFNHKQQLALIVYVLALELQAIGGTDYTSSLTGATSPGGLVFDAAQVFQTMTEDQRWEALINILISNAAAAGASPPASPAAALTDIQCLTCAKEDQLIQMILWLLCNLGPSAQLIR